MATADVNAAEAVRLASLKKKRDKSNGMKDSKTRFSARNKMMDYLARRDHSEKELRQKLRRAHDGVFTPEEIDTAIRFGKDHKWIPDDEKSILALAQKAADSLHRKKKGIIFINGYLREKGLPEVETNDEQELEKALELVKNKYLSLKPQNRDERQKLMGKVSRFLLSRGFVTHTIQKVISKGWK